MFSVMLAIGLILGMAGNMAYAAEGNAKAAPLALGEPSENITQTQSDANGSSELRLSDAVKAAVDEAGQDDGASGGGGVTDVIIDRLQEANEQKDAEEQAREELEAVREQLSPYFDVTGWGQDKIDYVVEWGARNNAYLSGTAMEGTGYWIASSAHEHDMDPRLCAAVATVESGCGAAPYGCEYNVWGWICCTPEMYSWEDGIEKWHSFFSAYFGGERYPISSMYG
ncbi:MAG: hypothetical protein BZ138_06270, partial [Methanosphaera sp. rholeuAM270]